METVDNNVGLGSHVENGNKGCNYNKHLTLFAFVQVKLMVNVKMWII